MNRFPPLRTSGYPLPPVQHLNKFGKGPAGPWNEVSTGYRNLLDVVLGEAFLKTVLLELSAGEHRQRVEGSLAQLGVAVVGPDSSAEHRARAEFRLVELPAALELSAGPPAALLASAEHYDLGLELLGQGRIVDVISLQVQASELTLRLQVLLNQQSELQAWQRHQRFFKTLVECQQRLLRAREEQQLFQDICQLIVEDSDYCMAWVGLAEHDEQRRVLPVAWSGTEQGYLQSAQITWDDSPSAQGPTGRAVREGITVTCSDFLTDPIMARWREAATQRGYRSSLALALIDDEGRRLGALTVYSPAPDNFDAEIIALFEQLAKDLALGLTALRNRQSSQRSRAELERITQQLHYLTASSPCILYALSLREGRWVTSDVSPNIERMTGYAVEQALQPDWWSSGVHPDDLTEVLERFGAICQAGFGTQEYRFRHADGRELWVLDELRKVADDQMVGAWTDISTLKASQEALRLSERRYRELFLSNPQPMWVVDRQSLAFLDVNAAALKHYGYTREQFLQLNLFDIRRPSEAPRLQEALDAVQEGLGRAGCMRHLKSSGEEILVDITYHGLQFAGRPALLVLAQDVTSTELARQSLEVQARRAEALLQLPGLSEQREESDFIEDVLELAEDLTGSQVAFVHFVHEDQEVIELGAWSRRTVQQHCQVVHESHYPISQAGIWADALREARPVVFNDYSAYPARRGMPEGHTPLVRFISVPVIEASRVVLLFGVGNKGDPYGDLDVETVQLIANDLWRIVQRRRAQERVLQLSRAVEQSPHSVVITDLKGAIQYVNDSFLRTTGYSRAEVLGQNPRLLKSGQTAPEVYQAMWQALTRGEIWKGELHNRRKDGSIYVESAILCPIRQSDGRVTHYVGLKEDITERQLLEAELARHRHRLEELVDIRTAELAEATRRAEAANLAKGTFLANMSHEIRTPLNAILGLSYLLRQSGLNPDQAHKLEQVDVAGRHLLAVINQILDLAKIEAGRFQLVETDFGSRELLEEAVRLVEGEAREKGLELRIDPAAVDLQVRGDVTRLRQALLNYLGNAIKFTQVGHITVSCRLEEDEPEPLLRFEVEDTGCGIEAEQLPRLFRSFEQLDSGANRRHGGTGLGLAITARMAELLGGQVGVESQLGQGSLFWFSARLPRSRGGGTTRLLSETPPEAAGAGSSLEELLRARFRGARILLAEDHPVNLQVASELLSRVGMVVETAVNGREALDLFLSQGFDLALVDLQMPELDGLEVARAIRRLDRGKGLPILAMTASVFQEDREACRAAGMDDFVAKPVEPGELYTLLYRWLSGHSELPSGMPLLLPTAAADPRAELLRIPGLESQRALAACNGDASNLLDLLRQFLLDSQLELAPLQPADGPLLERPAHRIKGAAATLGAVRLAELASRLEQAAREGALCVQPLELLRAEIAELLGLLPAAVEQPALEAPLPPRELVQRLCHLLAQGDADCLTLWQQHQPQLSALLGDQSVEFARLMDRFQFEDAYRILQRFA